MIQHVISVSLQSFPSPLDDDLGDIFEDDDLECGDLLDESDAYMDVVTTTFVFYPDEPDTVTMISERRDFPGEYAPYDFPRLVIEDLLNFTIGGSDDSQFVMARDDDRTDWVFVNQVDQPPVYARLRDIEDFLSATYAAAVTADVEIDDRELEDLLKGSK